MRGTIFLREFENIPCRVAQVAVCAFACGLFKGWDQLSGQRWFDHSNGQEPNEQDDGNDDHDSHHLSVCVTKKKGTSKEGGGPGGLCLV